MDDAGLREAIESLFAGVNPVQSQQAYERIDRPHLTFFLVGPQEADLPIVREALYESIKAKAESEATLCWRTYPITQPMTDGSWGVSARLSWWKEAA